jgi:hypothetical protein
VALGPEAKTSFLDQREGVEAWILTGWKQADADSFHDALFSLQKVQGSIGCQLPNLEQSCLGACLPPRSSDYSRTGVV